jgi:hypothetical protein
MSASCEAATEMTLERELLSATENTVSASMCRSRFTDYCCFTVAFTGAAGKQKATIRHNRNHRRKNE